MICAPSPIHGTGGFAVADIRSGTRVIEYVGEKISKGESWLRHRQENEFIFVELGTDYDVDGNVSWNPARFINHSCDPNCEALIEDGRIWIVATRDIPAGAEITFNYGYDIQFYGECPCHCGAQGCVGFIVAAEFFPVIRAIKEKPRRSAGARLAT